MNNHKMHTLLLRLHTLAVFRELLRDELLARLVRYFEVCEEQSCECSALCDAYASFVAEVYALKDEDLAHYILRSTLDLETSLMIQKGAGHTVDAALMQAASLELATLNEVANLTSEVLLEGLDEVLEPELYASLPRFTNSTVDIPKAYQERLSNLTQKGYGIYAHYHAFRLNEEGALVPVRYPDAQRLEDLVAYEHQHEILEQNTRALLARAGAANILLTGDAGTGKSSTIKALANKYAAGGLRILEVQKAQLHLIPALLDKLTYNPLAFIIFIDDLSFSVNDDNFAALKAILEGSVSAKSNNVALYATSNRRHLVRETFSQREGDDIHLHDTLQEISSLADRFGIHLNFSKPAKDTYLQIVHAYADKAQLDMDASKLDLLAERFATRKGGRSGRCAKQFVDSLVAQKAVNGNVNGKAQQGTEHSFAAQNASTDYVR